FHISLPALGRKSFRFAGPLSARARADERRQRFDPRFLGRDLRLLFFDLCLLLFNSVDEDGGHLIVFDAFNLVPLGAESQPRLDSVHLSRQQTDIGRAAVFPVERDWAQASDQRETGEERIHVSLVTQRRRAAGYLRSGITAERDRTR